jgi:hypothetical protein
MYILRRVIQKIAASLHNGFNPLAEPPAGLGHGGPWEVAMTSMILTFREAAVLWGTLLTSLSQMLHK